jgi:hypothetical protein
MGKVVRVDDNGYGVKFVNLGNFSAEMIESYLSAIKDD